jgi:hypothetical protein
MHKKTRPNSMGISARTSTDQASLDKAILLGQLATFLALTANPKTYCSATDLLALIECTYACQIATRRVAESRFPNQQHITSDDMIEVLYWEFRNIQPKSLLLKPTIAFDNDHLSFAIKNFKAELEHKIQSTDTNVPQNYLDSLAKDTFRFLLMSGGACDAYVAKMDRQCFSFRNTLTQSELLLLSTSGEVVNTKSPPHLHLNAFCDTASLLGFNDADKSAPMSLLLACIKVSPNRAFPHQLTIITSNKVRSAQHNLQLKTSQHTPQPPLPASAPTAATCTYQILSMYRLWNNVSAALYKPWGGAANARNFVSKILLLELLATAYLISEKCSKVPDITTHIISYLYTDINAQDITNALGDTTLQNHAALFSTPPNRLLRLENGQTFSTENFGPLTNESQERLEAFNCDYFSI